MNCPIFTQSRIQPHGPALTHDRHTWSYLDLHHLITNVTHDLESYHIGTGHKIVLLMPTCPEFIVLLGALFRLKSIAVLLNPKLGVQALTGALSHIRPDYILTVSPLAREIQSPTLLISDLTFSTSPSSDKDCDVSLHQIATMIQTSGSTSHPKFAVHTLGNLWKNAEGSNQNIYVTPQSSWLLSLPCYHVSGLGIIWRCWLGGGKVVIPGSQKTLEETLLNDTITHVSLVQTQLYRLIQSAYRPDTLTAALLGGSAFPDSLIKSGLDLGFPIFRSYGSTEMTSQITTSHSDDPVDKYFTSGRLLPNRELRIGNDNEILVRGDTLFKGYYLDNELISLSLDEGGWFRTGDLGSLDPEGYLHVVGRKDAMFISGGENIHPEEIEEHLLKHPDILQAIVVPVSSAEFGNRPVAIIQKCPDARSAFDGHAFLEGTLPTFKIPMAFFSWPEGMEDLKPSRSDFRRFAQRLVDANKSKT